MQVGPDTSKLIAVFTEAKIFLSMEGNDYSWSSWVDAEAAVKEIDGIIATLQRGILPDAVLMRALFAATGPIQEVSLSSGWAEQFLTLAKSFDAAIGDRAG
jgi:hypothetical protein